MLTSLIPFVPLRKAVVVKSGEVVILYFFLSLRRISLVSWRNALVLFLSLSIFLPCVSHSIEWLFSSPKLQRVVLTVFGITLNAHIATLESMSKIWRERLILLAKSALEDLLE